VVQAVPAEGSEPEGSVFLLPMAKKSEGEKSAWVCGQAGETLCSVRVLEIKTAGSCLSLSC